MASSTPADVLPSCLGSFEGTVREGWVSSRGPRAGTVITKRPGGYRSSRSCRPPPPRAGLDWSAAITRGFTRFPFATPFGSPFLQGAQHFA